MNTETAPFRIGQKVVALVTDQIAGRCRKDNVYTVLDCKKNPCGCVWVVDIGARVTQNHWHCGKCGADHGLNIGKIGWLDSAYFAPIQEQYADVTAEIAASLKETAEIPDTKVKEVCES